VRVHLARFLEWQCDSNRWVPELSRAAVLIWSVFFLGCSDGSFGRFEIGTPTEHSACLNAMFPFEPNFLAARVRSGSVGLFMQTDGGAYSNTDLVYIEVYKTDQLTHVLGPPGRVDADAIAEIEVAGSCPDLIESLYVDGTLAFEEFDANAGGVISGRVVGDLWSQRSQTLVAPGFDGSFFIEVRRGQPYEEFF